MLSIVVPVLKSMKNCCPYVSKGQPNVVIVIDAGTTRNGKPPTSEPFGCNVCCLPDPLACACIWVVASRASCFDARLALTTLEALPPYTMVGTIFDTYSLICWFVTAPFEGSSLASGVRFLMMGDQTLVRSFLSLAVWAASSFSTSAKTSPLSDCSSVLANLYGLFALSKTWMGMMRAYWFARPRLGSPGM